MADRLKAILSDEEREHVTKAEAITLRGVAKRADILGPKVDDLVKEQKELQAEYDRIMAAIRERMPKPEVKGE